MRNEFKMMADTLLASKQILTFIKKKLTYKHVVADLADILSSCRVRHTGEHTLHVASQPHSMLIHTRRRLGDDTKARSAASAHRCEVQLGQGWQLSSSREDQIQRKSRTDTLTHRTMRPRLKFRGNHQSRTPLMNFIVESESGLGNLAFLSSLLSRLQLHRLPSISNFVTVVNCSFTPLKPKIESRLKQRCCIIAATSELDRQVHVLQTHLAWGMTEKSRETRQGFHMLTASTMCCFQPMRAYTCMHACTTSANTDKGAQNTPADDGKHRSHWASHEYPVHSVHQPPPRDCCLSSAVCHRHACSSKSMSARQSERVQNRNRRREKRGER